MSGRQPRSKRKPAKYRPPIERERKRKLIWDELMAKDGPVMTPVEILRKTIRELLEQ